MSSCFCTGPINGQPLCPCMMRARGIVERSGRWIQPEEDLGASNSYILEINKTFKNTPIEDLLKPEEPTFIHIYPSEDV